MTRPAPPPEVAALFEEAADLVHRTAWRITGRREDAEDVLQSVFLSLLRSPPSPWPDNPIGYVHRAAVNASLDLLRRRRSHPEHALPEGDDIGPRSSEEAVGGALERDRLAASLRQGLLLLSPLEAEVLSLRCFEERSNIEIARILGRTPNHVGVTLHAARTKLRVALAAPNSTLLRTPSPDARPLDRREGSRS